MVHVLNQINLGGASIHMHLEEHEGKDEFEHTHRFQVQEVPGQPHCSTVVKLNTKPNLF